MDTMEKVAVAKKLIDSILFEFNLKIRVDWENENAVVLDDCDTEYSVEI